MFSRILIASRGEIALRIIRACKELNIETVAICSEADKGARYLEHADGAICIGPGEPELSYLNIPGIISAAEITDIEAIHPGYGFLAEVSHFAEVCESSKIVFIGPNSNVMRLMGNKMEARKVAMENKVPVIPGSDSIVNDQQEALSVAHEIGFPVLIKASAGGGGRGMRVAHNDISLRSSFELCQREAENAFKDPSVYIEKYIEQSRHIEVQILADNYGNYIHLGERDCSCQRRHQKLIEESPSPNISNQLRDDLCKAAIKLAKSVEYTNAGTVEFLVDKDEKFFFIEMNSRIQVEHPVTEMVTGIDLIKEQLKIAFGERLDLRQKKVKNEGVSIECRINAEDPYNDFMPSPGTITMFLPPGGKGVRVDSHIYTGYKMPPNYDSLLAKIIVHQNTRAEAIACMKRALNECVIEGIKTTIPLALSAISHSDFVNGTFDTKFIENFLESS